MSSRTTTHSTSSGRARKVAAALLLTTLFLVPMIPVGSADFDANSFDIAVVSGNTVGSSNATYNFTFGSNGVDDDAFRVNFPSGWDASAAYLEEHNFPFGAPVKTDDTSFVNLTAASAFNSTTTYYAKLSGINPPHASGTSTITAQLFDGGVLNDTQTDTITIAAVAVDADVDDTLTNPGSGAETDFYIDVAWNSEYLSSDSFNVTFPTAFDLSDATVTNGVVVGQKVGYDIQSAADFKVRIDDVLNPKVTVDTTYTFTVQILNGASVVGTDTFTHIIVPTGIDVQRTGVNTQVEEGKTDGDTIEVTLETKPDKDVTVNLDGGDQITFDDDDLTFTTSNWNTKQIVTLTAVDDAAVEGTEAFDITLTSESNDANYDKLSKTHTVTILDNDEGIVITQTGADTQVTEGDTVGDTYTVRLATKPTKTVTVDLEPHANLEVDDDDLVFTTSNWNTAQTVKVTSARTDDDNYQTPKTHTILHTASTTTADNVYDGETAELTVTIVDDEHRALSLSQSQIDNANKLVDVTLTENDDGIKVAWELPTQAQLDKIFDSDGEVTVEGVQILYSNSPYTLAETYDESDSEFDDLEWQHDFDDGGSLRTKYLVTMFYAEDVGKWDADNLPDTRDDSYAGDSIKEPVLDWWVWLIIAIVIVVLILLILFIVLSGQNRRHESDADWHDEDGAKPVAEEKPAGKPRSQKYDLECPVCDHHFSAKGIKPIKTECPNCGAKGTLN